MACNKHKRTLDTFIGDYVQHTHPELVELSAQVDINIDDIDQNLLDIIDLEVAVGPNSGNWQSTYSTVGINSADWESTYSTVSANSADWYDSLWNRVGTTLYPKTSGDSVFADTIKVNTGYIVTDTEAQGTTFWDQDNRTMSTALGNGVVGQHFKEAFMDGQNDTSASIANGTPVSYAGGIGNSGNFKIQEAQALSADPAFYFVGLMTETVLVGEVGKITTRGKVRGIQTNGANYGESWNPGDIVYVSETKGELTKVAPDAPVPAIPVALVISAHATNGTLQVRPTFPQALTMLSDVDGTPLSANGQILVWNNDRNVFDFTSNIHDVLSGVVNISAQVDSNTSVLTANSGNWESTYTTVSSNSAYWSEGLDALSAIHEDTNEPAGYIDINESSISFNDATRTFTIAPTGTSFSYYTNGNKHTKTSPDSIVIPDLSGKHFIYYDEGTLKTQQNFDPRIILEWAFTSEIYWDAPNSGQLFLAEERHGCVMDGMTHSYLHNTRGATLSKGGGLGNIIADGTGDLNAHAQFSNEATILWDEDIKLDYSARGSTENITKFYKTGAAANYWNSVTTTNFGVLTGGTGRAVFNENVGGTWQLSEVTNGNYVLAHVVVTNDRSQPYSIIIGQNEYINVTDARDGAETEIQTLILDGLTTLEYKFVATVIFETRNNFGNDVQSRIVSTTTGDDYIDLRDTIFTRDGNGGLVTNHGDLAGLLNNDHPQYTLTGITQQNTDDIANMGSSSGNWDSTTSTVSSNSANWFNARTDFGVLSSNPVSPLPVGGDVYYNNIMNMDMIYDDVRDAWLSRETIPLYYGRNGRINGGTYFRTSDGLAYSENDGFYPPYSGMIVGGNYTRLGSDLATFEATSDGVTIIGSTIISNSTRGNSTTMSGAFAPNTVIGIRNQSGSSQARNVHGSMLIKWVS